MTIIEVVTALLERAARSNQGLHTKVYISNSNIHPAKQVYLDNTDQDFVTIAGEDNASSIPEN